MFWNLFKKKKKEDANKQIESHGMIHKIEKPWKCRICNEIYTEDYTAGLCISCWEKEFAFKKNFYSAYKKQLELFLQEYGIKTNNKTNFGIKENGEPEFDVEELAWMNCIHLRKNERAIYTVICRNCVFGFPDNGIGFRYLYISTKSDDMGWAKTVGVDADCERLLAISSDEDELYYLTEKGVVRSSSKHWEEKRLFEFEKECRQICESIDIKDIETYTKHLQAEDKYAEYDIFNICDHIYYDADKKVFFGVFADGNYYHGYDVNYVVEPKKKVLAYTASNSRISLYDVASLCSKDKIPMFAVVDRLDVDDSITKYEPPTNVGYGSVYL